MFCKSFTCILLLLLFLATRCSAEVVTQQQNVEQRLEAILAALELLAERQEAMRLDLEGLKAATHRCMGEQRFELDEHDEDEQNVVGDELWKSNPRKHRFNRLASNLSPAPPELANPADDLSTNSTTATTKQLARYLTARYEAQLRQWGSALKEQLAHFRAGLNQMLAAQADSRYQFEQVSSQLLLIKDECSLAARADSIAPELKQPDGANAAPMRSSDMSAVVRLLGRELDQLLFEEAEMKPKLGARLRAALASENLNVSRRLDEIGSVVKQSAQLLQRLQQQRPDKAPTTLEVANNSSSKSTPVNRSRWVSGSKVPVKVNELAATPQNHHCQAPQLIGLRPTSCQAVRSAGANCSGKYLVWSSQNYPLVEQVYCEMSDNQGWRVVLRRLDKSSQANNSSSSSYLVRLKSSQENFDRDLESYKQGFGDLDEWAEFFVGLESLHRLTSATNHTVEMAIEVDMAELVAKALLKGLKVADETMGYQLTWAQCLGDCHHLKSLNGSKFSMANYDEDCRRRLGWWLQLAETYEVRKCPTTEQVRFALTNPIDRLYWHWKEGELEKKVRRLVVKVRQAD